MTIGIDLGGTSIKFGLVDNNNDFIISDIIPTSASESLIILDIINICKKLKTKAKEEHNIDIKSVGIGVPGVVTGDLAYVEVCKNLNWIGVPLKKMIEVGTGLKVYIENDASLATFAEYKVGSLKGANTGIMLTLGTGIGSGTIINGDIYRGSNGLGQEIGHMVIGDNFYNCSCGKNGCFETFSSATAVVIFAKKLLNRNSLFSSLKWKMKKSITAKDIFDMAEKGDNFALKVLDRTTSYLAKGVVNIINILDPDIITLGGGMATEGDTLLKMTQEKINQQLFIKDFPSAELRLAEIGNKAGILGAALLAKEEYNRRYL